MCRVYLCRRCTTPLWRKRNKKTMVRTTRKVLVLGSFYGLGRKLGRRKNSGVLYETVAASNTTATCGVRGLFAYHCAVICWRWLRWWWWVEKRWGLFDMDNTLYLANNVVFSVGETIIYFFLGFWMQVVFSHQFAINSW